MVEVKNIKGSSNDRYSNPKGYASWLEYWKTKSDYYLPSYCTCETCTNKVNVGAHVMKTSNSNKWYIVPLCYACNNKNEPFNVDEDYLVPVSDNNSYSTFF